MSFSNFFLQFFSSNREKTPLVEDTTLLQNIQNLPKYFSCTLFINEAVIYEQKKIPIPLLLYTKESFLALFELQKWSKKELQKAHFKKQISNQRAQNQLSFSAIENTITQQLQKNTHLPMPPFERFLILENLYEDEYDSLPLKIQNLLPKKRLVFKNTTSRQLAAKLSSFEGSTTISLIEEELFATLFSYYNFAQPKRTPHLATEQQQEFVKHNLTHHTLLSGIPKSGKTTALIRKIFFLFSENKIEKITLIKENLRAKELFTNRLKEFFNAQASPSPLDRIEVITPYEMLVNIYTQREIPFDPQIVQKNLEIKPLLLKNIKKEKKKLLICDDLHLLPKHFIEYLELLQKKETLLLVGCDIKSKETFYFRESFSQAPELFFIQNNPLAAAMSKVTQLLQNNKDEKILLLANVITLAKIKEDFEHFIQTDILTLESTTSQEAYDKSLFVTTAYTAIADTQAEHIILLDICQYSRDIVEYAISNATKSAYLFYEQECGSIKIIKEKYEKRT